MFGVFKSLKRVMTGAVIKRADTKIMGGSTTISLRLKESSGINDERYVVMAAQALGNWQYYAFHMEEFDAFVRSAMEIRDVGRSRE